MTIYDSLPYPTYSHPTTAPARVGAVARLFGMKTADIKTARVLEIGCASGGNLLPLAACYPEGKFFGIDLSEVQIAEAQRRADAMALTNTRLEAKSIIDIDLAGELFDFIIVHGFYSWVPEDVQKKMFEICRDNLSDNGLAYVSYNTKPGWNEVMTVRDMMLYHIKNFETPAEKVLEARRMLNFVNENISNHSSAYKTMIENEISQLRKMADEYIFHDHLEGINRPCYFHEFVENAMEYGLIYVGDTELPSMYLGNQAKGAAKILADITDAVRQEQYIDFLTNRRFRMSLLAKGGVTLDRKIGPESMTKFYLMANFNLKEPVVSGTEGKVESLDFVTLDGKDVSMNLSGQAACVCYVQLLFGNAIPRSFDKIIKAAAKIAENLSEDVLREQFASILPMLVFRGAISIGTGYGERVTEVSDKPEAFVAARVIGLDNSLVSNVDHRAISLSDDQRIVLQYINGKNTRNDIITALRTHFDKEELVLKIDDKSMTIDSDGFDECVGSYVDDILVKFAGLGLLVG